MSLTPEQKKQMITVTVSTVLSLLVALLAILGYNITVVQPQLALLSLEPALPAGEIGVRAAPYNVSPNPVRCKKSGVNCLEIWNGSDIKAFSDAGTTQSFYVDGGTGDLTLNADPTGGNAGAKSELSGLVRIKAVALGAGTNGATETTSYVDDSPTGEFAPIDADVTEAEGSTDSIYKFGASSYKAAFAATAAAADGFKRTITADDLEANESIGCWLYPSVSIASGDLQILLTDDGGARNFNIGALTASKWNWTEVDISSLAAGTGNVVTEFGITLTAQGATALGAFNLYMDQCYKWDATDEEALGTAILQDGVLNVIAVATAAASANTPSVLAEGTDYFVHYETGNDFIVWMTDQSAASTLALVAY